MYEFIFKRKKEEEEKVYIILNYTILIFFHSQANNIYACLHSRTLIFNFLDRPCKLTM